MHPIHMPLNKFKMTLYSNKYTCDLYKNLLTSIIKFDSNAECLYHAACFIMCHLVVVTVKSMFNLLSSHRTAILLAAELQENKCLHHFLLHVYIEIN